MPTKVQETPSTFKQEEPMRLYPEAEETHLAGVKDRISTWMKGDVQELTLEEKT